MTYFSKVSKLFVNSVVLFILFQDPSTMSKTASNKGSVHVYPLIHQ